MKEKKAKTGAVRISPEALKEAKKICLEKEISIKDYVNQAVIDKNKKELKAINA